MPKRVQEPPSGGDTQSQILEVAIRLFALRGFKAVTLKDIAREVGVKMASLYYYYSGKDELIEAVLERYEEAHKKYSRWLNQAISEADTLEELMDDLFNDYFLTGLDTVARLGMSITIKEQHSHQFARRAALQNLYSDAVENVQSGFDHLIKIGVIPPSNTKTLATLFMMCIMSANDLHIHEAAQTKPPIDRGEMYAGLRALLMSALAQGTLPAA